MQVCQVLVVITPLTEFSWLLNFLCTQIPDLDVVVVFQGWINTTFMFYAGYPSTPLISEDVKYDLPLAYLLVGGTYFFCSLLLMVRK